MPSWPSRTLPETSSRVSTERSMLSASQRQASGIDRSAELRESPMLRPAPSTDCAPYNTLRTPSRHGRSVSHPFPSLLASPKRSERQRKGNMGITPRTMREVDEQGDTSSGESPQLKTSVHDDDIGLRTGNCSTCNSTVRWPKHLDVYRCTACLMINDVKPIVSGEPSSSRQFTGSRGSLFANHVSRKRRNLPRNHRSYANVVTSIASHC